MILRVDTDHLRRILSASLPAGARAAEMFIESRVSLRLEIGDDGPPKVERRWESGAHLRRFSEGRHDSFILDSPTGDSLEALALHPEAIDLSWLDPGTRLGIARHPGDDSGIDRRPPEAGPASDEGPWSSAYLGQAIGLLERWLDEAGSRRGGPAGEMLPTARLEACWQEILVLTSDRDPARDTRRFVDVTLRARTGGAGRAAQLQETVSAPGLAQLEEREGPAARLRRRAAAALEPAEPLQGLMPVVFAPPTGGFLLHEICGHLLEADHVLRGASPFVGARGSAIASEILNLADDGSVAGMRGSLLFDDEGIAARRTPLIIRGTLVGFLSDRLTAFATDGISTGNGRRQSYRDAPMPRMTNLVIDPGRETFDEIMKRTAAGLLVTRLGRGRVDPATGRFVIAVEEGFRIESGRTASPVAGAVLRGTASEMLPAIDGVGSDAVLDTGAPQCVKQDQAIPFGILQPTLRVSSMAVTGVE